MINKESFIGDKIVLRNFEKHDGIKIGKKTGEALLANTSPYAIVDIDVKCEQEEVLKSFSSKAFDRCKIVKTASGGLHIYSIWDQSMPLSKNRYIKFFSCDLFDVDLFVPIDREKRSIVVLPGSKAKNHDGVIGEYILINDCKNEELMTLNDLKNKLFDEIGIDFESLTEKRNEKITVFNEELNFSEEIFEEETEERNPEEELKIFNALVHGFKNLEIHNDCNKPVDQEISLLPVICGFNSFESETINREMINEAFMTIYDTADLTINAKNKFFEQLTRNRNKKYKHHGVLLKILKIHNPDYYNNNILPLIKKNIVSKDEFLNSKYCFSDYLKETIRFSTIDDYISNLIKCLAFTDCGDYIMKVFNDGKIEFQILDSKTLQNYFNFDITIPTTIEEKELMRQKHKKISDTKTLSLLKELRNIRNRDRFKSFVKFEVIGDDDKIFSLFRAPSIAMSYNSIKDNPDLISKWLRLIEDQLFDEEAIKAFHHLLKIAAFTLKYHKKAPVFFIKYSSTGNTGKTYIDNSFKKLYGDFALVGINEQQLSEKHNGGLAKKLYRSYDEFSTDNYSSKATNNIIKRLTNNSQTVRSMNRDTRQENDFAIDVLNTNHADLYGMLNSGDQALLSRFCIIRFKERSIFESQFFGDKDIIDDINFPLSLYNYLMSLDLDEFVKRNLFDRYDSSIVQNQLRAIKESPLEDFLDDIQDCWKNGVFHDEEIEYITVSEMNRLYVQYSKYDRFKLSKKSFERELMEKEIYKIPMKIFGKTTRVFYRKRIDEQLEEFNEDCKD